MLLMVLLSGKDPQDLPEHLPSTPVPPPPATPPESPLHVGLVFSDLMELHAAPLNHPEQPQRHSSVVARLRSEGIEARCVPLTPRLAQQSELLLCHTAACASPLPLSLPRGPARVRGPLW